MSAVHVCPGKDIVCGDRAENWCSSCPKRKDHNAEPPTKPSNTAFDIAAAWLRKRGTAATGPQLFSMCQFADFVREQVAPSISPEQRAVIDAADQWWCEREIVNWDDADLARAVIRMNGDWLGCPECDHQCGEPCRPATVAEQLRHVDCAIAQLVHEGKLLPHEGYTPPEGWAPRPTRAATNWLALQQAQHTRATTSLINTLRALVGERQPLGIDRPAYQRALAELEKWEHIPVTEPAC